MSRKITAATPICLANAGFSCGHVFIYPDVIGEEPRDA
jgi:hypothetical protein